MAEDDGSAIKTGIPVATFHIEEAIRSAQGMLAAPADRAAGRSSRNRPHMRLAEFCLKSPASGDRAGSADVRGGPAFLVKSCERVRGGCAFGGGDVSVHRCRGVDPSVGGRRRGMRAALVAHDEVLRAAIEADGGFMFKHTGDGVCAAFGSPRSAVDAAITAQRALELPVRMGLATGEAKLRGADYFGAVLNRAARVMAAEHDA